MQDRHGNGHKIVPEFSGDVDNELSGTPRRVVVAVSGDAFVLPPTRFLLLPLVSWPLSSERGTLKCNTFAMWSESPSPHFLYEKDGHDDFGIKPLSALSLISV